MAEEQNNSRPIRRMGGPGGRRGPMIAEKPKDFKKAMSKLLLYCRRFIPLTIVAIVFASVSSIVSLIGPGKIKDLTNVMTVAVQSGSAIDIDFVANIALILGMLYVGSAILNYLQAFIMISVTQRISYSLRNDISRKINLLPLKYLDNSPHGDTLSRITNDVDAIASNLNNCIASLTSSIVLLVGCLVMMFVTNWILAICAVVASLISFVFVSIVVSKSQKYFARQQKELGDVNGYIEEVFTGHTIVKVCNAKDQCKKEFSESNEKLYVCSWKAQFFSGLMGPIMQFMGNFGFVVVCIVGAVLCVNGQIGIGTIAAFIIYIRLFSNPLSSIGQSLTSLQTVAACSERVFELLEEAELADESGKVIALDPTKVKGSVEFRHVNFGYSRDVPIIKDFSVKIKAGDKVAIVGPTGAGKTTLVNLLMRFYEVDSGDILIDGVNIKDITRENVHEIFSMVLQDSWIFNNTIKANIVYDETGISDEKVIKACKDVELYHLIKTLPKGIYTELNEDSKISVGQRQLLTIARAMVLDAPMLILDEATSSVDTRTELVIQRAMDRLMKKRTSFVIAHRLSTIKNADLILVLDKGNIVEQGTHKELLKKDGFYAELYRASFNEHAENIEPEMRRGRNVQKSF